MRYILLIIITFKVSESIIRDLVNCHDDGGLDPADGIQRENTFNWLAFVQYIHVTTGLDHHTKAPRIVLIHKQFGLGTAQDLLHLPKNYKLGNIVFGEYNRDEEECDLALSQIKMGIRCPRAYLEMPFVDVIPHPEFIRFGVGNSLAIIKLLRPLKSAYMLPLCLPSLLQRERIRRKKAVLMIDYISSVPRDFNTERLAKKTLRIYTHRECRQHRMRSRLGSEGVTHVLCTTGCGIRSGAPIVFHASDGAFEVIGLAAGGGECARRGQRNRLITRPPIYIDVYPYNQWIINVITANLMPKPYPDNFQLTSSGGMSLHERARTKKFAPKARTIIEGWRGRTYVVGKTCYRREGAIKNMDLIYSELFEVNADPPGKMTIFIKIFADYECKLKCVKMTLPNILTRPKIEGLNRHNVSVEFFSQWFPYSFYFTLMIYAKNATEKEVYLWSKQAG